MGLPTLDDLKPYLQLKRTLAGDQLAVVQGILDSAVSFIAAEWKIQLEPLPALVNTGTEEAPVWEDTAAPVTVRRRPHYSRFIRVPDAREVTALVLDGTTIDPADYELLPRKGREDGPYPTIELVGGCRRGRVAEITGRFGFLELPADLKDFILSMAARAYREGPDSQFSDGARIDDEMGRYAYFKQLAPQMQMRANSWRVPSDVMGLV